MKRTALKCHAFVSWHILLMAKRSYIHALIPRYLNIFFLTFTLKDCNTCYIIYIDSRHTVVSTILHIINQLINYMSNFFIHKVTCLSNHTRRVFIRWNVLIKSIFIFWSSSSICLIVTIWWPILMNIVLKINILI